MRYLINMWLCAKQLCKLIICLIYAQLTNSSANDNNFMKIFETQFHYDISTAYTNHMSSNILYIIIYYYYICLYTASSLILSFYHMIEISTVYTQLLIIHLFILFLYSSSKSIDWTWRKTSKLLWKKVHMYIICSF